MCADRDSIVTVRVLGFGNHQQSLRTSEPAANYHQHALGALLSRGTASQSSVHTSCVHHLHQELDYPTLGQSATGTSQDRRGGALAASDRSSEWHSSEDKVRDVGFVFARRSVGVLCPSRRAYLSEAEQHRRADQRQTSEFPFGLVRRTGQDGPSRVRISGSASRVSRGCVRNTSRELGALRWLDCDFENMSFSLQHSYYWRRGGHLKCTKTVASAKLLPMHPSLKHALLDWKSQSLYNQPEHFIFPSERLKGNKPLDLASVLKKKVQPAFKKIGIAGVGWHTFRHTVGTMLAEMDEHQLTIRDYLRHSNLHVTNKYLQATSKTKRLAQDKLVDAILPTGFCRRQT